MNSSKNTTSAQTAALVSDLQSVSGPWNVSVDGEVITMKKIGLMPPIKIVTISRITKKNFDTLDSLNSPKLINFAEQLGWEVNGLNLKQHIGKYFLSPVQYVWFVQNSIYIASKNPTLRHSCSMRDVRSMYSALRHSKIKKYICNYEDRYFGKQMCHMWSSS